MSMEHVVQNVKRIRREKGLSQKDVAERMDMNPSLYSRLENVSANPKISTLQKLCTALEVDLVEIIRDPNAKNLAIRDKVAILESLPEEERIVFDRMLDMAIENYRLNQQKEQRLKELDRLSKPRDMSQER